MTRRCSPGSSGAPSGRPYGYGTHSARGGFTFSVCSRTIVIPSQKDELHAVVAQMLADFGATGFECLVRRPLRTHERVYVWREAEVRLHQVASWRIGWEN